MNDEEHDNAHKDHRFHLTVAKALVVLGALMVYVGHFMPWISIDEKALRATAERDAAMYQVMSGYNKLGITWPISINPVDPTAALVVNTSGSLISIAWFYLGLILVVTAATLGPGRHNFYQRASIQAVALIIAGTILIFVLGSGIALMGIGFYLALVGFVMITFAVVWTWLNRSSTIVPR